MTNSDKVSLWLSDRPAMLTLWAGFASFVSYFCMYMYRKPFTAGLFEGQLFWGVDYKIVLVIAQVMGYAMSKFFGIRFISGMEAPHRSKYYIILIGVALGSLIGFMLTPAPYGFFWLFINGLPLGLIWGIVFQYLEGRRITEVLTVILSANFILSSGIAKSLGQWLIQSGIDETMMPALIGLAAFPICLFSIWMLHCLPAPDASDIESRHPRPAMNQLQRRNFMREYGDIMLLFIIIYITLTIIRDIRDNFGVEIWNELGFSGKAAIYTTTELPATFLILIILGLMFMIKDNVQALKLNMFLTLAGALILVSTTLMFMTNLLSPVWWMILSGSGLFIPYIIYNGILFDRLIGAFKITANVGFLMYIADAFGYLGSVAIMLWKNFGSADISWLSFYMLLCKTAGILCISLIILTLYKVNKRILLSNQIKVIRSGNISENYAEI